MIGIVQDDLSNLIDRLREDDFDSTEFAIQRYKASDRSIVDVDNKTVHVLEGVIPYPVSSFVAKKKELTQYSNNPPGIIPYINGGYNLRGADPSPTTVGTPLISGEQQEKIGIRWLFYQGGYDSGLTMWDHLSEDEVSDLDDELVPNTAAIAIAVFPSGASITLKLSEGIEFEGPRTVGSGVFDVFGMRTRQLFMSS